MARRGTKKKKRARKRTQPWTEAHVRRLFWRAGFGATAEEIDRFTRAGRTATVRWLLFGDDGPQFSGSEARPGGKELRPQENIGDAQLWWLDRAVRSRRPLVERMALFWHGHFATKAFPNALVVQQYDTLRAHALGRFGELAKAVMRDPGMLQFLDLANSDKAHPNENFARELMELFALGSGYGEEDIREAARALTGFRGRMESGNRWSTSYDPARHDPGPQTILGRTAAFDPDAVVDQVLAQKAHGHFLVSKLWSAFITAPLPVAKRRELVRRYRRGGMAIAPVVSAILADDALYRSLDRPDMVKSPAVFVAGLLRTTGVGVAATDYRWVLPGAGQLLFDPPSVAGWEEGPAWMSTATARMRLVAANVAMRTAPLLVAEGSTPVGLSAAEQVDRAWRAAGRPQLSSAARATLAGVAGRFDAKRPDACQRALRQLILAGPEAQLC